MKKTSPERVPGFWLICSLLVLSNLKAQDLPQLQPPASTPLSAQQVVRNMEDKNRERAAALRQFEGKRLYTMTYRGFPGNRDAEMVVAVLYHAPADKQFTIVSQTGSKFIIDHVFKKLLESEREAADQENQRQTALNSENYDFTLAAYETTPEGGRYVLDTNPKSKNKFLYKGKIWVDAADFAVVKIEAVPAKNPSFWIKKTEIRHRYTKVNGFWLPAENHTESFIRMGGTATLSIQYTDYKLNGLAPQGEPRNANAPSPSTNRLNTVAQKYY
jgi:hypothetical protein